GVTHALQEGEQSNYCEPAQQERRSASSRRKASRRWSRERQRRRTAALREECERRDRLPAIPTQSSCCCAIEQQPGGRADRRIQRTQGLMDLTVAGLAEPTYALRAWE